MNTVLHNQHAVSPVLHIPPETVSVERLGDEPRVDSRKLAGPMGVEHRSLYRLLTEYEADFADCGLMRFEIASVKAPGARGTKHERFALLNEDQTYLLLAFTKNTREARRLKKHLVVAFRRARDALEGRVSIDRTSLDYALKVEREAGAEEERGRLGGHLLSTWRHRKPHVNAALADLRISLQFELPLHPKEE